MGGLAFLLQCNFELSKIPLKLSNFQAGASILVAYL